MSDVSTFANRVIPIDVELYDRVIEEFPDQHVVGQDDSEYKLQLTLQNKNASSPYTVAASDLTNIDNIFFYFYVPGTEQIISKKATVADASNGIVFVSVDTKTLHSPGIWSVQAVLEEGDITVTYPKVPILVE